MLVIGTVLHPIIMSCSGIDETPDLRGVTVGA